jgi:tellurite resistance protein TerC
MTCRLRPSANQVFHRRARAIGLREALAWSVFWILLALAFNVLVFLLYEGNWGVDVSVSSRCLSGQAAAGQFLAGYVLEKSLSIDNIFVIAMIFAYFSIPPNQQHRILFWGILGAVVLRGVNR